jgi:hypothetical protein
MIHDPVGHNSYRSPFCIWDRERLTQKKRSSWKRIRFLFPFWRPVLVRTLGKNERFVIFLDGLLGRRLARRAAVRIFLRGYLFV